MFAITDIRLPDVCKHSLQAMGYSVLSLPPFPVLDPSIASHPDMLMLPFDDRIFIHKAYYPIAKAQLDTLFSRSGLTPQYIETDLGKEYPNDIALNAVVTKNNVLGRKDWMAADVISYADTCGKAVIDVKQGYAKCSTLLLGEKAAITADPSLEKAFRALSFDLLRISPGHILLEGYDYGFIGGTSGVCNNNVFFCGNIENHPDGEDILSFCHAHGFQAVCLYDGPLLDVGTIFFI